MIDKVKIYYDVFENYFEYTGYFISNKTKLISKSDSRECNIAQIDDVITVNCGKITGIFDMEDYFKKECKYFPKIAQREAAMCSLMWGLKLSDYDK
jgi:hypothetical protein